MMGLLRVWLNKNLFTKKIVINMLVVAGLIISMLAVSSHKLYVKSEILDLCGKIIKEKLEVEIVVDEADEELLYYAGVIDNRNSSNQDILQGIELYCVSEKEELRNLLSMNKDSWKWHRWGLIVLTMLLAMAAVLSVYLKYRKQMKLESNASDGSE